MRLRYAGLHLLIIDGTLHHLYTSTQRLWHSCPAVPIPPRPRFTFRPPISRPTSSAAHHHVQTDSSPARSPARQLAAQVFLDQRGQGCDRRHGRSYDEGPQAPPTRPGAARPGWTCWTGPNMESSSGVWRVMRPHWEDARSGKEHQRGCFLLFYFYFCV